MSALVVRAVEPRDAADLAALFERTDCPCYCRYHHFRGDKNDWLERCAVDPEANARELQAALTNQSAEARGVVAFVDGDLIGWMKVAPSTVLHKAYDNRLYRGLPVFEGERSGVWLIGCVLIDPAHRRQGVAGSLVKEAVALAKAGGASAVEGLPRRPREPVSDGELWTVPFSAFEINGFDIVHDFAPYPVMRRAL